MDNAPDNYVQSLKKECGARTIAGVVYLLALATFAYFAGVYDRFPGDQAISIWVQSWRTDWFDTVMETVSLGGKDMWAVGLVLLTAGLLCVWKRSEFAALVILATVLGVAFRGALKVAVSRPRPDAELVQVLSEVDSASFPSGHVMHYAILLGTVTFILRSRIKSGMQRWFVQIAAFVALISIGLSRIYLGVHWFSDVVGGYAFGAIIVVGAIWMWKQFARGRNITKSDY